MPTRPAQTRRDIAMALLSRFCLPQQEVIDIVSALFNDIIPDMLADGRPIRIREFGTFSLQERKATIGRNVQTGETIAIPARKVPHFRPSQALKKRLGGL